jgi:formylglycine-generating enzyme required for sulfatase activity
MRRSKNRNGLNIELFLMQPKPVTLPLEPLFQLLENAGFEVSPAAQLRAWRVLDGVGRDAALNDPAGLKWLLAPVFARNAEEQKRFYELFERYVEQVTTKQYEPGPLTWQEKIVLFLKNIRRALRIGQTTSSRPTNIALALLLLLAPVLGYFVWKNWLAEKPRTPQPTFDIFIKEKGQWIKHDSVALPAEPSNGKFIDAIFLKDLREGDTLLLCSTTRFAPKQDSSVYRFDWELALTKAARTEILTRSSGAEWQMVLHFPEKKTESGAFLLKITDKNNPAAQQSASYPFAAACAKPPKIPVLKTPQRLQPGQNVRISLAEKPRKSVQYRWEITGAKAPGGSVETQGPALAFTADSVETIQVRLSVVDTTQNGQCRADTSFTIPVGDERVRLPYKTLEYDPVTAEKNLNWASWLLLALAALAAGWYWWRWMRRKAPEPDRPRPDASDASTPETANSDRPPYYIPWRDAAKHLRPAREQYRFADALRLRQQSEDQNLDFAATLRATLERGGYPTLRYRTRTRPTEYLFMVDEQLPGHHQARLFRHLAETLRGQDVVLEMVWYDPDLRRCWGQDLPQGVPPEQLRRYFPQHRLVLLGDGHALLDAYADAPRLRPGAAQWLNGWPQRLLLTPQAPAAWNWREAVLYQYFGLYPADLRGLLDAAGFVEGGLDAEDLPPTFEDWKTRQLALRRPETNPEYQTWRTLEQHDAYLAPYGPALRRWWMAAAVHPDPEWEITLAIGRALDITPTHDRLLALSRIPALREGRLHPGLRRAMLRQLPPDDEMAARRAVLEELEAVQHLTEGSHVGGDTAAYIAVQAFLLEPQNPERQTALSALLAAGALSRTQEEELNLFAAKEAQARQKGDDKAAPGDIRAWLAQNAPEAPEQPRPKRPFYTPDFWKAVACTLLCLGAWVLSHPAPRIFDPGSDTLMNTPFVRETLYADSAQRVHNQGVTEGLIRPPQRPDLLRADSLLQRALDLRGGAYPLAERNRLRNQYNIGVNGLGDTRRPLPELLRAAEYFLAVLADPDGSGTDHLDAAHGAGVALFYAGRRDSARTLYPTLLDAGYFDTLTLRPNLQTLLAGAVQTPIPGTAATEHRYTVIITDAATGQPLNAAVLSGPGAEVKISPAAPGGRYTLTQPGNRPPALRVSARCTGYADSAFTLRPGENTLRLRPQNAAAVSNPADITALLADIERSMIRVPGGTFRMGSDEKDEDVQSDEKPAHDVTLRDFYMGRTEVTNAQFAAFLNEKGNQEEGGATWINLQGRFTSEKCRIQSSDGKIFTVEKGYERHPVIYVSWYGVTAYCKWLSQKAGKNYRLPTEAEWEYAARGGPKWQDGYKYAGSNTIDEVAWYDKNSYDKGQNSPDYGTHAVATKKPNQLGLYDLSGNVWEWCSDWYDDKYYEQFRSSPAINPLGAEKGGDRVYRGGGWGGNARVCRSAIRNLNAPTCRSYYLGFRLVLQ